MIQPPKFMRVNPSRIRLQKFVIEAAHKIPKGALVLDAGAGDGMYKDIFKNHQYHATDLKVVTKLYGDLNYISDLTLIPVKEGCYDAVVCTQVLEHVPEPDKVLTEFYRILKPGGTLWISAPLFYPEHEIPYDFFRYTRYGFEVLLNRNGFKVANIEWLEGFFGTLMFQCRFAARELLSFEILKENFARGLVLFLPSIFLGLSAYALSFVFVWMELFYKYTSKGMCKNYAVSAFKPETAG